MSHPLWIIGIDGLEPSLLQQWCDEGLLPNLNACRKRGVSGKLLSTPNMITAAAWTTIGTGVNPGRHGIYNFVERVPGQYRVRLPTSRDRELPTFWEWLSDAGHSVINARVPMSYPVGPINGLQVADWLAPSPHVPGFAHPEALARDLRRRFRPSFWLEPVDLMSSARHDRIVSGLLAGVDHTADLMRFLLERESPELFFGVFREADCAGHALWGYHSGAVTTDDPAMARQMRVGLRHVYQRIDARIGDLLELMPSDANLIILSDHGMGGDLHARLCMRPLLEAAGLMVPLQRSGRPRRGVWQRLRPRLVQAVPWALRRRLRPLDDTMWARGFTTAYFSDTDFTRTRAFSYLPNPTGEIWLNLQRRDPMGVVEPGEEQAELTHDITRMLLSCRETRSERPLVQRVHRREELFTGHHSGILADLHVTLDPNLRIEGLEVGFRGRPIEVAVPPAPDPRLGMHRPHAAFVACGPDIAAQQAEVRGTLMDVAPTALRMLGAPIPSFMEGRVLSEILKASEPSAEPSPPQPVPAPYSDAEMSEVEQRLANLGYL